MAVVEVNRRVVGEVAAIEAGAQFDDEGREVISGQRRLLRWSRASVSTRVYISRRLSAMPESLQPNRRRSNIDSLLRDPPTVTRPRALTETGQTNQRRV